MAAATASGSLSSGGIVVPPASGWADAGVTSSTLNADGSVSWCCTTWIVPLPVAAGDVLGTVSIPVRDNGPDNGFSTGGNNVVVMVGTPSADGSTFDVLLYATTSGDGDLATMTLTFSPPHVVTAGENLQIRLKAQTPGLGGPTPATHVSWSGPATAAAPALYRTVTIPIVSSITAPSLLRSLVSITGSGAGASHVAIPLSLAVGQTLTAVRVRAADSVGLQSGGAVSHFAEALLRQDDSTEVFTTIATATPSPGTGIEQTVAISPLSVQIAAGSQYWVALQNASGTGQSAVYRLEIDVQ